MTATCTNCGRPAETVLRGRLGLGPCCMALFFEQSTTEEDNQAHGIVPANFVLDQPDQILPATMRKVERSPSPTIPTIFYAGKGMVARAVAVIPSMPVMLWAPLFSRVVEQVQPEWAALCMGVLKFERDEQPSNALFCCVEQWSPARIQRTTRCQPYQRIEGNTVWGAPADVPENTVIVSHGTGPDCWLPDGYQPKRGKERQT